MGELIFEVTVDMDGRYLAEARDNGIATEGASFEEMKAKATNMARAYFAGANSPPKTFRIVFVEVLMVA
jgi:hypothetical protein